MEQLDQKIDEIQMRLLREVADLHEVPAGALTAFHGQTAQRTTTANIDIVSKEDGTGIDIRIKPHTVHESVHIPVVLSPERSDPEMVYNDFYVGEGADVVIVAGCGIHNSGDQKSEHDGIHRFFIGKMRK